MRYLLGNGFNFVSLKDIARSLSLHYYPLPRNAVALTFDDGFMDNYHDAFSIVTEYDIPATIFLTTGMIGGTNSWLEKEGFPKRKMLTWAQILEMYQAGISFGAHTVSHLRLSRLTMHEAHKEIDGCKKAIEDKLGRSVDYFAYPYGQSSKEIRRVVNDCSYELACSTRAGFNYKDTDRYNLRRIEIFGNDPIWKLSFKLKFGVRDMRMFFARMFTRQFRKRQDNI
jgi:peptidoglycan/xylan/chitin deacetylase (PgdA/CDA1 family)